MASSAIKMDLNLLDLIDLHIPSCRVLPARAIFLCVNSNNPGEFDRDACGMEYLWLYGKDLTIHVS